MRSYKLFPILMALFFLGIFGNISLQDVSLENFSNEIKAIAKIPVIQVGGTSSVSLKKSNTHKIYFLLPEVFRDRFISSRKRSDLDQSKHLSLINSGLHCFSRGPPV